MALTSSSRAAHPFLRRALAARRGGLRHALRRCRAAAAGADARMVVEAKELVYDQEKNTVTARGATSRSITRAGCFKLIAYL